MSKRNKNRKYKMTDTEKLLAGLHSIVRSGSSKASTANSLISWFLANQYWTDKQTHFASSLVNEFNRQEIGEKIRKRAVDKYYLYAISDGIAIKLGYSKNVPRRLKEMQTGQSAKMSIVWKYFVGATEKLAAQAERKLHRYCKKHRIRGEWFHADCMLLVEQFTVRNKVAEEIEQEEHDIKMIETAQNFI